MNTKYHIGDRCFLEFKIEKIEINENVGIKYYLKPVGKFKDYYCWRECYNLLVLENDIEFVCEKNDDSFMKKIDTLKHKLKEIGRIIRE